MTISQTTTPFKKANNLTKKLEWLTLRHCGAEMATRVSMTIFSDRLMTDTPVRRLDDTSLKDIVDQVLI